MKFTLYELLKNHYVTIPIIQRDYAQGRENASEVRVGFVSKLFDTLNSDNEEKLKLHLDFVYGYVKADQSFIPLDGQQRLTTLFLLHWYIACKEGILTQEEGFKDSIEIRKVLEKFSYETRISSERFCKALVDKAFLIREDSIVSEEIRDLPWFNTSWEKDPTVSAMLTMLDEIHGKFFNSTSIWNKLITDNQITFEFIDIKSDEFKLTDELYIKMNSRGKPLTKFENFKAQFSDLLNKKDSEYFEERILFENKQLSYKQYFSIKMDGSWTDLFWKNKAYLDSPLDTALERFIKYVTEVLYYVDGGDKSDFDFNQDTINSVYAKAKNVLFLFNSFDVLASVEDLDDYFNSIFSLKDCTDDCVKLFYEDKTNLFIKSITEGSFETEKRILFYGLLFYKININETSAQNDIKYFLRILRNLLIKVRQVNTKNRIEYTTNLRLSNLAEYSKFIHEIVAKLKVSSNVYHCLADNEYKGFSKESIENERQKAKLIKNKSQLKKVIFKLEDHDQLQGNIDVLNLESPNIIQYADAFYDIWNEHTHNSLIVRALLSFDDYAVETHYYTAFGKVYYFGKKANWNRILTSQNEEKHKIKKVLNFMLEEYIMLETGDPNEKLKTLISKYDSDVKDWRYYFIKYYEITAEDGGSNLYAWTDEQFNIQSLGNAGPNPLLSYHINPYILALHKRLIESNKFELWHGRYSSSVGAINIKGRLELRSCDEGWEISNIKNNKVTEALIKKYNIYKIGNYFYFKETEKKDRIEIGKEFCEEVLGIT